MAQQRVRTGHIVHKLVLIYSLITAMLIAGNAYANDDFDIEGFITSIGDSSLTVADKQIYITAETEIEGDDGDISFEDLQVGDFVEAEGDIDDAGNCFASEIELENGEDEYQVEVEGIIITLGDNSLTVGTKTFIVTEDTEFEGEDELSFEDLQIGDYVEVEGFADSTGTCYAEEVELEDDEGDDDEDIEVEGSIEEIGEDFLIVSGIQFLVTDETEIEGEDDEDLMLSDLAVGDFVEVDGFIDDEGNYVATEIDLEDDGNDDEDIEVTGAIEELSDAGLVVAGISISVDDQTEVFGDDDEELSFDDLAVGMIVEVEAIEDGEGGYLARQIEVEDFFLDEVELEAAIEEIGDNFVVVLGVTFSVDENTIVLDEENQAIDFASLQVGDEVEIRGEYQADETLLATHIKLEDDDDDNDIELTGLIDFIGDNFLDVAGAQFFVDENTVVLDHANNPISFTDLTVGMIVEVDATILDDDTYLATEIKIEDAPGFAATNGDVHAISETEIIVGGPSYLLTCCTVFLDEAFQPITFEEILVGDEVEVWFNGANEDGPIALQVKVTIRGSTSIDDEDKILPGNFTLHQNYPNPFNPETTIRYHLPAASDVLLEVYTMNGQRLVTLANGRQPAGVHATSWNGSDSQGRPVATGIYYYRMVVDRTAVQTRKMILLK